MNAPEVPPPHPPNDPPHDPSKSAWQRAIDYGIDVSLLEDNLRLTPDERLAQLVAMQRLYDAIEAERHLAQQTRS